MNTQTGLSMDDIVGGIVEPDARLEPAVRAHLDDLTKPRGSLGRLEDIAARYCLATGAVRPVLGRKRIVCFAGDHGVTQEGVSAYPSEVTPQMVMNMLAGGAAINVLARHAGADLLVVDIGVNSPLEGASGLVRRKVRNGAANIARGPAMSVEEAKQAIRVGIDLATEAKKDGVRLIGTGEMGIGNTTPAAALIACLAHCAPDEVAGRGTGLDDAGLARKRRIIAMALDANRHRLGSPVEALAAVGGLEISGICGLVLGAAYHRMPVVVDGYISSAGAVAAIRMNRAAAHYLFFSHLSDEAGHRVLFERLGVRPILDLGMRLGEGTGAALAMSLIEAAVKLYNEMATFSSAGVSGKSDDTGPKAGS